jgi:hypothetical protein
MEQKYTEEKATNSKIHNISSKILSSSYPLAAIICGFEQGGTTLLSEILRGHPDLDGGFEGGFLLADNPSDFSSTDNLKQFYSMMKSGWGLDDKSRQHVCESNNWHTLYERLVKYSKIIKDKNVWLFDKTPRYMLSLEDVMLKVPDTPCIVITRDPRAVMWSRAKRHIAEYTLTIDDWENEYMKSRCRNYRLYVKGFKAALNNKNLSSRILHVSHEKLCLYPEVETNRIFDFLGLSQNLIRSELKPKFKQVHGQSISSEYVYEYQNNLSEDLCQKIIELTTSEDLFVWN